MREKHLLVASHVRLDQNQTHNIGVCPDWEPNPQPFSEVTTLQPTEPHRPRLGHVIFFSKHTPFNPTLAP